MKKSSAFLVAILCIALSTASYAQLTTSTMKLIRGTSHINFTTVPNLGLTTTYTWPQAPATMMPLQSDAGGVMTFAPIDLGTQVTGLLDLTALVTGVLPIANGGTNSSVALIGGRIMVSNGSQIVENPSSGVATDLLRGDLTWGAIDLSTLSVTGVLPVTNGGTGAAILTQDGILLGNGVGALSAVALTDGQVLVGNAGAPTGRTIVAGSGIGVVVDATNITITNTMAGSSTANGLAPYTSGTSQTVDVNPGVPVSSASRIFVTVTNIGSSELISAGVIAMDAATFTVSISTDVDCVINWLIINP
jgi:hypothetical protein